MQSELRLAPYFSPVRGLRGGVLTTLDDCLPYADWWRAGNAIEAEHLAATWELVSSHRKSLEALGAVGDVCLTIESHAVTLVFRRLDDRFGLTFVFDSQVPLGVARLRVDALCESIGALAANEPAVAKAEPAKVSAPVKAPVAAAAASAPSKPPQPAKEPEPFSDIIDAENEFLVPTSTITPPAELSESSKNAAPAPAATVTPPTTAPVAKTPAPAPASSTMPSKMPAVTTAPARRSFARGSQASAASPLVSQAAVADKPPSMGSRLLAYLERYAPDTHAALLRVSLQTGLPVTLLRQPDNLSADEFTQVAESVRNILGVEHLNL